MKANEAPKRIWIDPATDLPQLSGHIDNDSVEYTRTDAFMKKAVVWISNNCYIPHSSIEDFKAYMKGE